MGKIHLTKHEKEVLRLIQSLGGCPETYPYDVFAACVRSLQRKGFVRGFWSEEKGLVTVVVTDEGMLYMAENPTLRNPVDWKWIITTAIALASVIIAAIALFVACSLINK